MSIVLIIPKTKILRLSAVCAYNQNLNVIKQFVLKSYCFSRALQLQKLQKSYEFGLRSFANFDPNFQLFSQAHFLGQLLFKT